MSEILSNTGVKLWAETDYSELWLTVFDQLTGQCGKSNIRLIDEAIGKINDTLDGYKFEFSSDEDRLYISKGDSKLPVSLIDSNGHVASKVDGTTITIDESGVVKGIPVDDALSEISTNPLQNKVIAGELKSIKSKIGTDESTIKSNTKRIEANETAISTLNGTGDGSVKKAVSDGIAKVVAGAPEDFDTLKEMSDWISTHETSASAMNSAIKDNKSAITALQIGKADKTEIPIVPTNVSEFTNDAGYLTEHQDISNLVVKEEGKGLSSNDYTNEEKTKLGGVGTSQGRNLIPYPLTNRITNGITYTVQSDGSVLANGTASAENNAYYNFAYKTLKLGDTSYTLSCEGLPKSVYVYVYDETIGKAVANVSDTPVTKTFVGDSTHTYSLSINVGKGTPVFNLEIKPILEMGTIAHAYEPISESNVNLKKEIDKTSTQQGQNLIPYPYYRPDSYTNNGITWTVNEDGSVTANGTATATAYYTVFIGKLGLEIGKNYVLTITTVKGQASLYLANKNKQNINTDIAACRTVNNSTLSVIFKYSQTDDFDSDKLGLYIVAGTTLTNCIIKFQLERGTIRHEYQPTTLSNPTLKKEIGSALQPESIVNNQTTTVAGFALDARQANPNIDGSLAKQISDLNGSLNGKKVPTIGIENIFTGNPFCLVNNGSDVISVQTDWDIDNGGYRVKNIKYPAGTVTNLTVSLSLPANSIVIVDVNTLNGENIDIQGSLIRSNFTSSPEICNLSIRFTGRTNQVFTDIRYMPLVIHLG